MAPRERRHEAVDQVEHAPGYEDHVVERDAETTQQHSERKPANAGVHCLKDLGQTFAKDLAERGLKHEERHSKDCC